MMHQFNPHSFDSRIQHTLQNQQEKQLYRQRQVINRGYQQGHDIASVIHESSQQTLVNFSSNDYLGLACDPSLVQAWQQGLELYGCGSGASPLVTGQHTPHAKLEHHLATWLGFERALLFSSGYSANQAVLLSLLTRDDCLIQDKLNHASLMEAGMLSPATMKRFHHNDLSALQGLLEKNSGLSKLVVTEGAFSMDGDLAPLAEIHALCQQHHSWLMVDDAHGCGVLGEYGRGSCDIAQITPDILIVTFGKAFGIQGAAVLCSDNIAEFLIQKARHYIYSTAMPPAQAYALLHACQLIEHQGWRREKLLQLSQCFSQHLGSNVIHPVTPTPIKPIIIGDSERALDISQQLKQRGFLVSAIRPPTVAVNSARLRVTLTAAHTTEQVIELANAINEVMDE